jgi:CheY-like chemotaxis protein
MFAWVGRFLRMQNEYRFDFDEAKRKTRILLIDDDASALPISHLQASDYAIRQEKKVTVELLQACERGDFDIILLDYNGIAPPAICPDDGFGVFDRIRHSNPDQYIIAISGQTYDIARTEYFAKANDWLKKPTDLSSTKTKIDKGIAEIFDKSKILARVRSQAIVDGATSAQADKLARELGARELKDLESAIDFTKKTCGFVQISGQMVSLLRSVRRIHSAI